MEALKVGFLLLRPLYVLLSFTAVHGVHTYSYSTAQSSRYGSLASDSHILLSNKSQAQRHFRDQAHGPKVHSLQNENNEGCPFYRERGGVSETIGNAKKVILRI